MGFFDPTADEIAKATSGDMPEFKHGDVVEFVVTGCKEKENEKGAMVIVETTVNGGEFDKREVAHFFRNNQPGLRAWMSLLRCFWTDEQIIGKQVNPGMLIGKKVRSTCKISAYQGKNFVNFDVFEAVNDVPNLGNQDAGKLNANDIPF